eukprot:scaffold12136_cov114-Skeletonema_dohrnii-CCMP3373.AAC.1
MTGHNPTTKIESKIANIMCHRTFLLSQSRLASTSGRHRQLNILMTTLGQHTRQSYRKVNTNAKRIAETAAEATPEPPTARQLVTHAVECAIPMIGFGFMVSL